MREPAGQWNPAGGDHHLDLDLEPWEWEALFFAVLGAPRWERGEANEDVFTWERRQKRNFEESLAAKGYEMLGRITDMYEDCEYLPHEVLKLREECFGLKRHINNSDAAEGLRKLVVACNEAEKIDSGLVLLSD
jgi:hypothetical protein